MRTALVTLITLALVPALSAAADPDFFLLANECKTTVGSLVEPGHPIKIVDGAPFLFACRRVSQEIVCDMRAVDGTLGIKGPSATFSILLDSPPELIVATKHAADFISINLTRHTFVVITRTLADNLAGSKVCQGAYLTAFEMQQLQKQGDKK